MPDHLVNVAKEAGAVEAGGQDLVTRVEKENFTDFDVAISTPDMMRFVGRLGKVLGPKGLMPSPKAGTVTPDVANAVRGWTIGLRLSVMSAAWPLERFSSPRCMRSALAIPWRCAPIWPIRTTRRTETWG